MTVNIMRTFRSYEARRVPAENPILGAEQTFRLQPRVLARLEDILERKCTGVLN